MLLTLEYPEKPAAALGGRRRALDVRPQQRPGEFLGLVRPAANAAGTGNRRLPARRQLHGVCTHALVKIEYWLKLRASAHFIVQLSSEGDAYFLVVQRPI